MFVLPFIAAYSTQMLPKAVAIVRHMSGAQQIFCSGVPLSERITLTAAHCFHQSQTQTYESEEAQVTLRRPNDVNKHFKVIRALLHPDFDPRGPSARQEDFDLALVESESLLPHDNVEKNGSWKFQPPVHFQQSGFWLAGFSPVRLDSNDPNWLTKSATAWSSVQLQKRITQEGKFLARAVQSNSAAACAGDSGAPLWQYRQGQATLIGIVVQGNCQKGDVKVVDLKKYSAWIHNASKQLNEARQSARGESKNDPWHQAANDHKAPRDRE